MVIKTTQPLERLSVNFEGPLQSSVNFKRPLQSSTSNKYLLVAIDEFSRFPFAIPCKDTSSKTVIQCLQSIFSRCVAPSYIRPRLRVLDSECERIPPTARGGFKQDNPLSSLRQCPSGKI